MKREMIQEEYCKLETCKLLKEAGFPQEDAENGYEIRIGLCGREYIAEPSQSIAMRWLREVHRINIRVNWHSKRQQWFFDMLNIANLYDYFESEDYLPTFEAAAEAGIQVACEHLLAKPHNKD